MSGRYVMMGVLSAAIATLGLLLSSPAVVIGAMLLSPLMGPIILLGFSFGTVDWNGTKQAVQSLAVGLGLSLCVAIVLTWASPLKEPTAEILARTRPNLFDLLIAAFSGLAGGYAVIRQRGETVIGVAIATALMPPLATVGFGIGTGTSAIALGALLLFATNLVAIAIAAAAMAALYGFLPHHREAARNGLVRHAAVVAVLLALCVPLTLSLQTIALESRATASVRRAIQDLFGDRARITSLSVRLLGGRLQVDGLVATPKFVGDAAARLEQRLKSVVSKPSRVNLGQVVLADPAQFVAAKPADPDPIQAAAQSLHDAVPFPTDAIAYDPVAHGGVVLLRAGTLDIPAAFELEYGLRAREGLGQTFVVPSLQPLPSTKVTFPEDQPPQLAPAFTANAWALKRWHAVQARVGVCGMSERDKRWSGLATAVSAALAPIAADVRAAARAECRNVGDGVRLLTSPG
jgi:uncharacterized hydrophobic protein (TIGR00271 family)